MEVQPKVMSEPVLDVPAIDMTDAAKPQAASGAATQPNQAAEAKAPSSKAPKAREAPPSKRNRPARPKNAPADRPPSRTAKADTAKRTRDGSVGRNTFHRVKALLQQGKNKTEAFKQVAADTGRNSGTVAANYYRVAVPMAL